MQWRNTALQARFFFLDASSLVPMVVYALHMSWATFWFALFGVGVCFILSRRKITPLVMLRQIRLMVAGNYRPVSDRATWRRRSRWNI